MAAETVSILRIDSSMRQHGSVSRDLAEVTVAKLRAELADSEIVWRDLKSGVGHVNSAWRDASLGTALSTAARPWSGLSQVAVGPALVLAITITIAAAAAAVVPGIGVLVRVWIDLRPDSAVIGNRSVVSGRWAVIGWW